MICFRGRTSLHIEALTFLEFYSLDILTLRLKHEDSTSNTRGENMWYPNLLGYAVFHLSPTEP
jgi:hypothetical protein